jgi:hypothetical protein
MYDSLNISDYIDDIANAISEVSEFIEGMTFESFLTDKKTSNAVFICPIFFSQSVIFTSNAPDSLLLLIYCLRVFSYKIQGMRS